MRRKSLFPFKFALRMKNPRLKGKWRGSGSRLECAFAVASVYCDFVTVLRLLFSRGRKIRSGRLMVPEQSLFMVLPPSFQVWVPLRSAWRRTKVPAYLASY